jgi:single-strand DNA-binding protein
MNQIIIKGRLTRDPETKEVKDTTVTRISVAVNRRFKKDEADFFDCSAWGKTGEFVQKYFTKGQEILIAGEMQSRKYKTDLGENRTAWDIRVDQVEFCGSKKDNTGSGFSTDTESTMSVPETDLNMDTDAELPF